MVSGWCTTGRPTSSPTAFSAEQFGPSKSHANGMRTNSVIGLTFRSDATMLPGMPHIRFSPLALLLPFFLGTGCAWISNADRDDALQSALQVDLGVPEPPAVDACEGSFELTLLVAERLADLNLLITLQVDGGDPLDFEAIVESIGDRGRVIIDVPLDALPVEGGTVLIEVSARIDGGPTDDLSIDLDVAPAPDAIIDADGDGFGGSTGPSCAPSLADEDCDDTNEAAFPGADEVIGNDTDEDCDGLDLCYVDGDFDGYGSTDVQATEACDREGFSYTDDDCDDGEPLVSPGQDESPLNDIDDNCDDIWLCTADADGDTYGDPSATTAANDRCSTLDFPDNGLDCDDSDGDIFPGANEIINDTIDQDCDGLDLCYADIDDDGVATDVLIPAASCDSPGASPAAGADCDDGDPTVYPGADEVIANDTDEDCDGLDLCYADLDQDGFGNSSGDTSPSLSCGDAGVSYSADDCADATFDINPDATEIIGNDTDEDCDGLDLCYVDADGDGATSSDTEATLSCTPNGFSATDDGDCDDSNDAVFPGATEIVANGLDDDCQNGDLCYIDADQDTYGDISGTTADAASCADAGFSTNADDCDDTSYPVNPGVNEVCDGVDNNCDTFTDDTEPFWVEGEPAGFVSLPVSLVDSDTLHICGPVIAGDIDGSGAFEIIGHSAEIAGPMTLSGTGAASLTNLLFTGADGESALTITTNTSATLSGVQIFCANGLTPAPLGGGILGNGALFAPNSDLEVADCQAVDGGGIHVASEVDLVGASIHDNTASGNGGAIFVGNGAFGTISTGSYSNNVATDGGGVYLDDPDLTITTILLNGNMATGDGGAVYARRANSTLLNLTATNNAATRGGAAYLERNNTNISGLNASSNSATGDGGVLFIQGSNIDASGLNASSNTSDGEGGAVYIATSSTGNLFVGGVFNGNSAAVGGGALRLGEDADADVDSSSFSNNTSSGTLPTGGGSTLRLGAGSLTTCTGCCEVLAFGNDPVVMDNGGWSLVDTANPSYPIGVGGLANFTCDANTGTCTADDTCTL